MCDILLTFVFIKSAFIHTVVHIPICTYIHVFEAIYSGLVKMDMNPDK